MNKINKPVAVVKWIGRSPADWETVVRVSAAVGQSDDLKIGNRYPYVSGHVGSVSVYCDRVGFASCASTRYPCVAAP